MGDPAQSVVEWEIKRSKTSEKTTRLEELIQSVSEDMSTVAAKEEWVHAAEQIITLLVKHLPFTTNKDGKSTFCLMMLIFIIAS